MKDRLIELMLNAPQIPCIKGGQATGKQYQTFQNIADHILADGWIRPPLSLNQIVWCKSFDGINQCKVSSLTQKADGSFKIRLTNLIHKFVFEITPDKIGKTVFLTKEEAEEKLKELKENAT